MIWEKKATFQGCGFLPPIKLEKDQKVELCDGDRIQISPNVACVIGIYDNFPIEIRTAKAAAKAAAEAAAETEEEVTIPETPEEEDGNEGQPVLDDETTMQKACPTDIDDVDEWEEETTLEESFKP